MNKRRRFQAKRRRKSVRSLHKAGRALQRLQHALDDPRAVAEFTRRLDASMCVLRAFLCDDPLPDEGKIPVRAWSRWPAEQDDPPFGSTEQPLRGGPAD